MRHFSPIFADFRPFFRRLNSKFNLIHPKQDLRKYDPAGHGLIYFYKIFPRQKKKNEKNEIILSFNFRQRTH